MTGNLTPRGRSVCLSGIDDIRSHRPYQYKNSPETVVGAHSPTPQVGFLPFFSLKRLSFVHGPSNMRAFASVLLLTGSVLALPAQKRKNVVPATCDPNVVQTVCVLICQLHLHLTER